MIRAVFLIDLPNHLLYLGIITFIYGHGLAGWHEKGEKRDLAYQVRVLIEHLRIGLKAAHNIFGGFDTIHPHNGLFAQQGYYLPSSLFAGQASHGAAFARYRDGDGVGADTGAMTFPLNGALFEIDNSAIEQCTRSFDEITSVALRLETNNVVASQTTVNSLGDIAGQEMPAAHIGPGDVNKLLYDDQWMAFANHRCGQVELVVMEHDDNAAVLTINLSVYRVGNSLVCYAVTICPVVLDLADRGGVLRGVIHVML